MIKNLILLMGMLIFATSTFAQSTLPISEGIEITLRNTLQDAGEAENTYASLFGQADDAFDEFGSLSADAEFPTALAQPSSASGLPFDISGLYSIDFTQNSISFAVLPTADDPFWSGVFGLFPDGKFDRYYFTFSEPHKVTSFTSDNPNLNVRIDSDTVLVVELTGGYDVQPGVTFSISLNPVVNGVPTMGEWFLISMAILFMILGTVAMRQYVFRSKVA